MQRDAEAHAEEDKKAKEAIEIKNNADTLVYQSEKQLKDLGDKVPEDKKKSSRRGDRQACAKRSKATTPPRSRRPTTTCRTSSRRSAPTFTSRPPRAPVPTPGAEAGGRPGPQAEPQADGPRKDEGDVVDAEFEVVDEDKK